RMAAASRSTRRAGVPTGPRTLGPRPPRALDILLRQVDRGAGTRTKEALLRAAADGALDALAAARDDRHLHSLRRGRRAAGGERAILNAIGSDTVLQGFLAARRFAAPNGCAVRSAPPDAQPPPSARRPSPADGRLGRGAGRVPAAAVARASRLGRALRDAAGPL